MTIAPILLAEAAELIHREGRYLDNQRWDDWLALYATDAVFWLPAWRDERALTDSPDTELSLIYCAARAGLEDRVWRVRSGLSAASTPLPRTSHLIGSAVLEPAANAAETICMSSWICHVFDLKRGDAAVFFGQYEHTLRRDGHGLRIVRKKIVLVNDRIPTMLDFYCV
jgi:3-phenylpropionate/cinnamic acid dioxygenase small subunit